MCKVKIITLLIFTLTVTASCVPLKMNDVTENKYKGSNDEIIQQYTHNVQARILKKWEIDEEIRFACGECEVRLSLQIKPDGTIENVFVEKKSINTLFNETVFKAVKDACPLEPFPKSINKPYLVILITFEEK